ncbi:hypothetical protein RI578_40890 (plasmid) [Streptomyces sp. BB1-1-1]|uniref:hypothetical protein n=1 Tax=Streptomyces sp. BB1-1-1 TaxID=3074430 RepID=UPI002877265E|nr:hypothetical protein [Streptomyces sp. BB1-1-1]WND40650.1 hypothetical protein RI578_40890 [Streptomyces sp. BB1-1-1]
MKLIIPAFDQHTGRERQNTETRRRMGEVFGLARGFEVGTVLGLHRGRPLRHDAPPN